MFRISNFIRIIFALFLALPGFATGADKAPDGMVFIPGGEFLMGSSAEEIAKVKKKFGNRSQYANYHFSDETPKKKVYLPPFYIDRHEVTNDEYAKFLKATGYPAPPYWQGGRYPAGKGNYPVIYVSRQDAMAYAKWTGKRLPTESEWEKAARGTDGRVFPWGNKFDPFRAATAESDLQYIEDALCNINTANRVERAEGDLSPYGVHDMAGNVREWTATTVRGARHMAIIKGGSWVDLSINARAAYREAVSGEAKSHIIGFRCVKNYTD
jgi:formylglycine-generating enzyme required for sulfatase activity